VAMGVLTQTTGTWDRPMAYLLKRLHNVATRWPGCFQVMAAFVLLVQEATKLTLGQDLTIKVPHELSKGKKTNIYTDSNMLLPHYMYMGLCIRRETF
uniref:Uncharacterized protein n=1 Tax=Capra hircus TaxID=9925 RepID=A0A8C2NCL1_CAPHI